LEFCSRHGNVTTNVTPVEVFSPGVAASLIVVVCRRYCTEFPLFDWINHGHFSSRRGSATKKISIPQDSRDPRSQITVCVPYWFLTP
jgi:hypothetical protein